MPNRARARVAPLPRRATAESHAQDVAQFTTTCTNCNLRELCPPCCGLTHAQMERSERVGFHRVRVRRGEYLYRSGERFTSLYAVRRGFFKCTALLDNGRDQVTGFALTGEVFGTDGIGQESYTCNAVALEPSEVCIIPYSGLQNFAHAIPELQRQIHKLLSREIVREHGVMLLLGSMNAEERLAVFLLSLSRRYAAHGYSATELHLRMTREEIGSYLGLTLETVSRTFSKFQDEGLVEVRQKHVLIADRAGLDRVIGRGQS